MPTELITALALLCRMEDSEIQQMEDSLLENRKQAWRTALSEQARQFGCNATPNDPTGGDLRVLRAESGLDALGIATTWERDVERELTRLFNANPQGSRSYYASGMEQWTMQRAAWKSRQIALNTVQSTRFYAQQRFIEENRLRGNRFLFVGPPPVCRVCVGHFAAGVVDQQYVDRNPTPVHIGCPHEWRLQTAIRLNCSEIWVG